MAKKLNQYFCFLHSFQDSTSYRCGRSEHRARKGELYSSRGSKSYYVIQKHNISLDISMPILIDNGADIHAVDRFGGTPMSDAEAKAPRFGPGKSHILVAQLGVYSISNRL